MRNLRYVTGIIWMLIGSLTNFKSVAQVNDSFFINGNFTGEFQGYIYLKYDDKNGVKVKDSTLIRDGKFYFKGQVNSYIPRASLRLSSNDLRCDGPNTACFSLDNSQVDINVSYKGFQKIQIKGVRISDTVAAYFDRQKSVDSKIKDLERKLTNETNKSLSLRLEKKINGYKKVKLESDLKYCRNFPNSSLSPYLILLNEDGLSDNEVAQMYYALSDRQQNSYFGFKVREIVNRNNEVHNQIGSRAPLFTTTDINNKIVRLDSIYSNKIVLLDFWASWCLPCRASHPHLRSIYSRYKEYGFEIIGIAANVENEVKWREAVQFDSLTWIQILVTADGKAILNNPTNINEKYFVTDIPIKILIDRNGYIIGRYTYEQESEMDKKLKDIFWSVSGEIQNNKKGK